MPDWNEIVRLNAASVANAAYRIIGNLSDAEDVSQEVFAEAFRKWNLSQDQNWAGVLKRMSVCRAIDFLRKQRPTTLLPVETLSTKSTCPEAGAISRELENRLRVAVGKLPPRESEVFCLVFFEQLSHQQVATELGISRSAVAKSLSNARTKLEIAFREISTGESR